MRLRAAAILLGLLLLAAVLHDVTVAPGHGFGARAALGAIAEYQTFISPHLHGVVVCRFTPTCSHYGAEAIRKYGLMRGGARTAWRLARCNPWTAAGTYDPP